MQRLRILLLEALQAGKYSAGASGWQPHTGAEALPFEDRVRGVRHTGILVLTSQITQPLMDDSILSELHSYVIVAPSSRPEVDLGTARADRIQRMQANGIDDHYWAVFLLRGTAMVTIGTPPSSCRLIGEVLNLQMPSPFVQQRVCSDCHALNGYHAAVCERCGMPLSATGR
jgi:hypothetical protein